MQLPDMVEGHAEDDRISDDVRNGIADKDSPKVEARTRNSQVPGSLYWMTLEDACLVSCHIVWI